MTDLERARSRVQEQWNLLRNSVEMEFGVRRGWNWPWAAAISALAVGAAAGFAIRRQRRRRIEQRIELD